MRNLNELREIIDGVYSGKLEYNQDSFFSGTACCIAGWAVVLDFGISDSIRSKYNLEEREVDEIEGIDAINAIYSPWDYAQYKFDLTYIESNLIFKAFATKELHYAMLDFFAQGGCLEDICIIETGLDSKNPGIIRIGYKLYTYDGEYKYAMPAYKDMDLFVECLAKQGLELRLIEGVG